jgi:ribosome-interacting GTPase 1
MSKRWPDPIHQEFLRSRYDKATKYLSRWMRRKLAREKVAKRTEQA